jgi:hypothetical protein
LITRVIYLIKLGGLGGLITKVINLIKLVGLGGSITKVINLIKLGCFCGDTFWSNGRGSPVNRALDGSTYPGKKLRPSSFCKTIVLVV